ncbi:hypothetical protein [Methylomonas sp. UP202]|uniref:hypothetical protein n=1 Tax=Methylomonas sp. UP202 TaxID=3040943 RepID=UPI002479934C|nr:hypothetical protein [Methylomonas sp. UP202]WGS84423.1 hypothetical protein QC632_15335 [Methylomonas sp. UP202]
MSKSTPSNGPSQINLVNSKRLQALRSGSPAAESGPSNRNGSTPPLAGPDAASARLQLEVRRCLAEILRQLPPGKQRSLFKIRYGVYPEQLESLAPNEAARILGLPVGQRR